MMKKRLILIGSSILLMSSFAQAADDVDITDETMQQTRTQLQNRVQSMTNEERVLYRNMNENGESGGTMNRYGQGDGNGSGNKNRQREGDGDGSGNKNRKREGNGDGSGNKNRQREGNSGSYGSGYGSRQGGGSGGGGKGRRH